MDRIGRYVVVGRLGSGGFATVYRADDPVLELPVAIKVLADNAALDPQLRARFINEARVMRRINSPRVATVYDIAELPDGRPYLVMQLADRGTLHDRLQDMRARGQPVSVGDIHAVVRGLGDALAAVHDAGVVHRDVKPSNVLLGVAPAGVAPDQTRPGTLVLEDEMLILADFGLAKNLAQTRRLTLAAGTDAYMAPEQRRVGANVDGRADIYAASAVVAELVAAAAPVPSQWMPATTEALRRGMADEPESRPVDARAWSTELTALLPPPAGRPSGEPSGRPRRVRPPTRRRPWRPVAVTAGLSALLLVGALLVALAWLTGGGPTIVGPRQLAVGQHGVYYAEVDDVDLTWTVAGRSQPGDVLTVPADQEGTIAISVRTNQGAESAITVTVTAGDDQIGIDGPYRASVDDTIVLRPEGPPGTRFSWRDGDGVRRDSATLTIHLTSPGTMTVSLSAELDRDDRTVSHTVTVLP